MPALITGVDDAIFGSLTTVVFGAGATVGVTFCATGCGSTDFGATYFVSVGFACAICATDVVGTACFGAETVVAFLVVRTTFGVL